MGFLFGIDSVLNATQPDAYSLLEMDHRMYVFMMTFGPIWPLFLGITGIVVGVYKLIRPLQAVLLSLAGFSFPLGRIPDIAVLYIITDLLLIVSFALVTNNIYDQRKPTA